MSLRKEIMSLPEKAITEEETAGSMSRSKPSLPGLKQAARLAPDSRRGRRNGKSSSRVDELSKTPFGFTTKRGTGITFPIERLTICA